MNTTNIANSTIAANTASSPSDSRGGALLADANTTVSLSNSTVAANSSAHAAIIVSGSLTESFDIVDNPIPDVNCSGIINDAGNNLWFGGAQGACRGVNADPNLGPLANNGGVSRTMALNGPGGIDTGSFFACPTTDQRGFPRVGSCDMGAYEANSTLVDTTPPACSLLGVTLTNPKQQNLQVADSGRGLQAVAPSSATNARVVVPWFLRGTKLPVEVTAVKVDQRFVSRWGVYATDQASNTRLCT